MSHDKKSPGWELSSIRVGQAERFELKGSNLPEWEVNFILWSEVWRDLERVM